MPKKDVAGKRGREVAIEGPQFVELCPECETKLRAMAAEKLRLDPAAEGLGSNAAALLVPLDRAPFVFDLSQYDLDEEYGMAYRNNRGM